MTSLILFPVFKVTKHYNYKVKFMAKYIFVTGGVTSSLGKGIVAASLAKLLQARGLKTTIQKFDPYIKNHLQNKFILQ